jgi:DNA-directed RNA polymerase specialized sigma24 family protein
MSPTTVEPAAHAIPPLTRGGYERTEETEAHIQRALSLPRRDLVERAQVRDKDHSLFIGEEALVFLIRYYHLRGDALVVDRLCDVLVRRINWTIKKWMREAGFRYEDDKEGVVEATQEVVVRLFGGSQVRGEERREGGILDLESDKSDFAQARFWHFLRLRTIDVTRAAGVVRGRDAQSMNVSDVDGNSAGDDAPKGKSVPVGGWESITPWEALTQEHESDLVQAAMRQLPNHPTPYRDVLRLRYLDGWQIEADDGEVVTLSTHYGRTPRTISSWLRKAEERLRDILQKS